MRGRACCIISTAAPALAARPRRISTAAAVIADRACPRPQWMYTVPSHPAAVSTAGPAQGGFLRRRRVQGRHAQIGTAACTARRVGNSAVRSTMSRGEATSSPPGGRSPGRGRRPTHTPVGDFVAARLAAEAADRVPADPRCQEVRQQQQHRPPGHSAIRPLAADPRPQAGGAGAADQHEADGRPQQQPCRAAQTGPGGRQNHSENAEPDGVLHAIP